MNNFSKNLSPIFKKHKAIKLVYLFGSKARGNDGPMSDFDFAIYTEDISKGQMFDLKLKLIGEISHALKSDLVDVVMLNEIEMPEMKYAIICEGKIVFERKDYYQSLVEPLIRSEYFDFRMMLKLNGLSKFL